MRSEITSDLRVKMRTKTCWRFWTDRRNHRYYVIYIYSTAKTNLDNSYDCNQCGDIGCNA